MTTRGLLPLAWPPPGPLVLAAQDGAIALDLSADSDGPFCAPREFRLECAGELGEAPAAGVVAL